MVGLILLFLVAAALIAAPIGLGIFMPTVQLGTLSSAIMTGAGIALMVMLGIVTVITKLYQRSRANEAFVRTGMGGVRVIQDGGALVIPVIHEFLRISLETLKLEVRRDGEDALITKDSLRADIGAEFFVKVQPDKQAILQAARSLGDKMTNVAQVKTAVEDKLISALRSVAATKTLTELHTDRDAFVEEVTKNVNNDLAENGLTLESVTISRLDQTAASSLSDGNIFDAQGLATIAAITEAKKTERNQLERQGEQNRKEQDVETRKRVLGLEQEQKNAEATQAADVAKVAAEQDKIAKEEAIKAQKAVDLAEIEKQQKIEVAAIDKKKASEVAMEAKTQAIAEAARLKAGKEAELAKAQALREKEMQAVKTVEVEATAEREKRKAVIAAEAKAEQIYVTDQRAADAKAYQTMKDAEARKLAADADAEAVTKKATAEANAEKAKAEGQRALQLVPVEVERAKVEIDRDRIETVVKPELEAREKSGKVAQDYEIAKLHVEADKLVRIESAKAAAMIGSKIECKLYGAPEDAARMISSFAGGQKLMEAIEGFMGDGGGDLVQSAVHSARKFLKKQEQVGESEPVSDEVVKPKSAHTPPANGGQESLNK